MVKLPELKNKTALAIFSRHVNDNEDWRRQHLGASLIGSECHRYLWYTFRWANKPGFDGRMLRLFERGHREEEWIIEELRAIGMRVETVDKTKPIDSQTGKHPQFRFKRIGGHFAGSIDGGVLGVLEALKTWHLLEVKTSNDKRFIVLQKEGVKKSNPRHYDQMQVYMHELKLKRALYICVNKNDDHIYTERIHYDKDTALAILAKAEVIISAPEPLTKISEDPTWWGCKFCDSRPHCHLGEVEQLQRNCRTCLSSTPLENGTWVCEYFSKTLSLEEQRKGCDQHLFIPKLLPWEAIDVHEPTRTITYKTLDGHEVIDSGQELVNKP